MERALFRQVNHVVIVAPAADELFATLSETLALPVAWPFADFGTFASGGVSTGDCAIELLRFPVTVREAVVWGVALEPMDGPHLVSALAARDIACGDPETAIGPGGPMWTNVRLNESGPAVPSVFSCDYHFIDVAAELARLRRELADRRGGPLGVLGCARLELSPTLRRIDEAGWQRLLEPMPVSGGLCAFAAGPDIRLIVDQPDGREGVVLTVRSLASAEAALGALGWGFARAEGALKVTDRSLQGLALELVEA